MTTPRDPDRLISSFLFEGPVQMHDQVYDAVRVEIERRPQRAVFGPWRIPALNKLIPVGLGAAVVVGVLLVGAQFLGSPSGGVGTAPTPIASPEPSLAPTPSLAPSPVESSSAGLPLGPFTIEDEGAIAGSPRIAVTIPAAGWSSIPAFGGLGKGADDDPPQSSMLLWSYPAGTQFDVYGDPCQWDSTRLDTPAMTADEIAAALAVQASRDATEPADVTVGEHSGKSLTLHVPDDAPDRATAFADCDKQLFGTFGPADGTDPWRYQQGPGQIDELWILDVNGSVAIIDAMYRADTPPDVIDEMRAIAESATFEAP
jgi:hypothetical protein